MNFRPRPQSITFLALLSIILGVLSIMTGLVAAGFGAFSFDNMGIPPVLLEVGPIVVLFGVFEIVCSIGFLEATRWARSFGNLVAALTLVGSLAMIGYGVSLSVSNQYSSFMTSLFSGIGILPSTVSILTLVVLRTPHAKMFLDSAGARHT